MVSFGANHTDVTRLQTDFAKFLYIGPAGPGHPAFPLPMSPRRLSSPYGFTSKGVVLLTWQFQLPKANVHELPPCPNIVWEGNYKSVNTSGGLIRDHPWRWTATRDVLESLGDTVLLDWKNFKYYHNIYGKRLKVLYLYKNK